MTAKRWLYDAARRAYVSPGGKVLDEQASVQLRNAFALARGEVARDLAQRLAAGTLSRAQFAVEFGQFIEDTMVGAFLAGRGGMHAALREDALTIQRMINDQLGYADGFLRAIDAEGLSPKEIEARAAQYADAAVYAYEEARSIAHGFALPQYPADGATECLSNCRCYWSIEETDTEWRCTWIAVNDSTTCPGCAQNAREWAPLVIPK